jgi:hypothetical protein
MDDFKRGATEWGRKARKAQKRICRSKLARTMPDLLLDAEEDLTHETAPEVKCKKSTCGENSK